MYQMSTRACARPSDLHGRSESSSRVVDDLLARGEKLPARSFQLLDSSPPPQACSTAALEVTRCCSVLERLGRSRCSFFLPDPPRSNSSYAARSPSHIAAVVP